MPPPLGRAARELDTHAPDGSEVRLLATDSPSKRWDAVAAIASADVIRVLGALSGNTPASRKVAIVSRV